MYDPAASRIEANLRSINVTDIPLQLTTEQIKNSFSHYRLLTFLVREDNVRDGDRFLFRARFLCSCACASSRGWEFRRAIIRFEKRVRVVVDGFVHFGTDVAGLAASRQMPFVLGRAG